jgi:hypothetical protein
MSHPDEGTMQMLLDGELDSDQRARIESHIRSCASCAARLAEARAFLEEADRLVEVLAVPEQPARRRGSPRRRTVMRTLAWAASIVLAVGVGYWGRGPGTVKPTAVVLRESDKPSTTAATPPAALPPAEAPARSTADRQEAASEAKAVGAVGGIGANELTREQPAPPAAPAPTDQLLDARANAPAAKVARSADEPVATWRVISMEEGVRLLGGQIRLIDGLTADRVETGPGTAVAGADPAVAVVRVVYAAGAVTLDEQRSAAPAAARREDAAKVVGGAVAYETTMSWQERGGIRFVVTGSVTPDSLRALGSRVR